MRSKLIVAVAGAVLLAAAVPVMAHHAFGAEFAATKPVKFTGTVTQMEWVNPHAWIHLDVKKADGTVEQWMVEAGTPNTLFRRGFSKTSLAVGTQITVDGFMSKDGRLRANGRYLTLPDGRELFIGSPTTPGGEDAAKNPNNR